MNRRMVLTWGGAACVAVGGAISVGALAGDEPKNEGQAADVVPVPFRDELLKVVAGYEGWWCATEAYPHVSPADCVLPQPVPSVRISEAEDTSPHGKKLYYLFVKQRGLELAPVPPSDRVWWPAPKIYETYWYAHPLPDAQPTGQVLVKQSWTAVGTDYARLTELSPEQQKLQFRTRRHSVPGYVINHSTKSALGQGEQRELFVMMKMDPAMPGTDNGWVYGVLSPDGKQVLNAGRIESCMGCHVEAPHDRLFGLE